MNRKNLNASLALFPILCLAIILSGCGGGAFKQFATPDPIITSFTSSPTSITAGGSASLTGVFSGGTGVITPGNISVTSGTAVSVTPSSTTTYTLTATNSVGVSVTQAATVTVNSTGPAAPTITSFIASPTTITTGGSANLTGVFSGGTGVITPGNIAATSGTAVSVTPSSTTTYTLTVTNTVGVAVTLTATVTVNPTGPAAPTITSFIANPTTITAGGSANLTGIFIGGTGVITPGNISAISGTGVSVTPSSTTTYTLTVTNSVSVAVTQTATVTVTPLSIPSAPLGLTATGGDAFVSLSWSASSGATSYNVYRGTTPGGENGTPITTGLTSTAYTDSTVTNGTPYYYKVAAVNTAGTSAQSNEASATPTPGGPAAPTGLTAIPGDAQVALSWTASSGATSYHVKRSTTSGGPYTQVAAPTGTTYTDTGLSDGTTYYYVVTAVNTLGESGNSNEVAATPVAASGIGLTIPTTHPRLWWNAARLAQAKAWYAANPNAPVPSDTSSADYYIDRAWRHVVGGASCAEAITWVMNHQVPASQYSPSANGSDEARWFGDASFVVYDWCYDQLTPQQRSDFLNNIAGSGAGWNNYLTGINQQAWGGPDMLQSNYNIGNLRNDIDAGIATYWENQSPATTFLNDGLVTRWANNFVPAINTSLAGGVGQEGIQYADAFPESIIPLVSLGLNGRDFYNETEYFKEQVYWLIYSTTPSPTPNLGTTPEYQLNPFSDDEDFVNGGELAHGATYQSFMNVASNYWSALDVGKYARQWVNTVGAATYPTPTYVLSQDSKPAAMPYTSLPLDYYASGNQYLYGRKAWDTTSSYFMWQLGISTAGVGHAHIDTGNFNLWRGGRWLSRETTGYGDTITGYGYQNTAQDDTNGIIGHNGIVFGTSLSPGIGSASLALMPGTQNQTIVRRLDSAPGYVYADVDLSPQYLFSGSDAQYNTGAAVHVERELLFLRDLETTLVFDRVTTGNVTIGSDTGLTAANEVNSFVIHFETNPTLEDASHLTAMNGNQALRMTTLVPAAPTRRVINEQSCGACSPGIGQYRVELDTSGAAQRYFLNVLQGRDATGSDIVATVVDSVPTDPNTGTFTVTLQPSAGNATTVVFNKGQTSNGGTVNLAGAGVVALRAGVQTISYSDSGPVWGK